MKYYLSLGSNINAEENIAFAIEELNKILSNVIISSTHKTKAEGFKGDDFLNLVLAGDSDLEFNSKKKLDQKNCDWIIANDISDKTIGFDSDDNEVSIFYKNKESEKLLKKNKSLIASEIVDRVISELN